MAHQVVGDGPVDLLVFPPLAFPIDLGALVVNTRVCVSTPACVDNPLTSRTR